MQGASYPDLRQESARIVTTMPFDGYAIGGLAVGETRAQREDCTATVTEFLPQDRPRYLMGVGTTLDLLEAVHRGVDMFDCILPTALGKQGVAFTSLGRRDLRRSAYRQTEAPLDPACACYTCSNHSIAYLFHLQRVNEPTGAQLIGLHNLHFYAALMATMRRHIMAGTWNGYYREQRDVLDARDSYGKPPKRITKATRRAAALQRGHYEVVTGAEHASIRDRRSGERMHPVQNPMHEAQELYVKQSRVLDRLRLPLADPLVIWDVGLGAAYNAMAVLNAVQGESAGALTRRLQLVSFENDLDSLRLALAHPRWFPHLHHAAPQALLRDGSWVSASGELEWRLMEGDFAVLSHQAPSADLIFYDPFSLKADRELWTLSAFRRLLPQCAAHGAELLTYSYSTSVRAALLAAGFYVAKGAATGAKAETTIALTPAAAASCHQRELLGSAWLAKWQRSDAQVPPGECEASNQDWREAILQHPQFG